MWVIAFGFVSFISHHSFRVIFTISRLCIEKEKEKKRKETKKGKDAGGRGNNKMWKVKRR